MDEIATLPQRIDRELKEALKRRDSFRLEVLRLMKSAVVYKRKETGNEPSEQEIFKVLRSEMRRRQDSIAIYEAAGKNSVAAALHREIDIINEFMPPELSPDELERHVRDYIKAHPEVNHPGKLTGIMVNELGGRADSRVISEICRKVLGKGEN